MHACRIWIWKGQRLPNLADQVRRAGWALLPSWSVFWLWCQLQDLTIPEAAFQVAAWVMLLTPSLRALFILNDPWFWTKHQLQPIANVGSVPDQPINQNFNWALEAFFFLVKVRELIAVGTSCKWCHQLDAWVFGCLNLWSWGVLFTLKTHDPSSDALTAWGRLPDLIACSVLVLK